MVAINSRVLLRYVCSSNVFSLLRAIVTRNLASLLWVLGDGKHAGLVRFDVSNCQEGENMFFPGFDPTQWRPLLDCIRSW